MTDNNLAEKNKSALLHEMILKNSEDLADKIANIISSYDVPYEFSFPIDEEKPSSMIYLSNLISCEFDQLNKDGFYTKELSAYSKGDIDFYKTALITEAAKILVFRRKDQTKF